MAAYQQITHTAALLAIFLSLLATQAAEFGGGSVVHLTASDFDEKTNDGAIWFIKFYAPWCGHCKRLAPVWRELANAYEGQKEVKIAHVDCTVDKDICTKAEVKGYPSLKLFFGGDEQDSYKGQRDVDAFKKFLDRKRQDLLSETTS